MKKIVPDVILQYLGPFVAIVVIFIHTVVLDRDLDCDCMRTGCIVYMVLPFFIIFLLQLWVQKTLSCSQVFRKKLCSLWLLCRFYDAFKALCVALLWVVSKLIDGDWYVCCGYHNDTHLACRDKSSLESDEKTTVAALKSHSMIIGMSVLLSIVIVAVFIQCCRSCWERCMSCCKCCVSRCKCCVSRCKCCVSCCKCCVSPCESCMSCCEKCCSYESLYYEAVLQKEDKVLTEFMKTKAEETLNQGIEKHIWKEEWKKELIPLTIQEPRTRTTTAGTRTGTAIEDEDGETSCLTVQNSEV